nr:N-methyl-L-tryptophan oxidase [Rubrobacter xylanophilus]
MRGAGGYYYYGGRYDAIVVGVGAMGSAALYHLARRGKRVLGLERFGIPHAMGSSHGHTRIIRLAYYEHPSYVVLLRRAYELWRELEREAGEQLLHITGSIDAGPEDSWVFRGSWESARMHELPHEVLTGSELHRRYPAYRLPKDHLALLQPEGGFLKPERCIVAHVMAAQARGAEVHAHEKVLEWGPSEGGGGVRVRTERGTYEAEKLILSAGAWMGELAPEALGGVAVAERQVLAWLQPQKPELFRPQNFPVFNLLVEEGRFYGFPVFGVPGFKFGKYHHLLEELGEPDRLDRQVHWRDEQMLREFAERYFPEGCGPTMDLQVCMFTNTQDNHFIIDLYPGLEQVVIASPCSGHGFKFASVVGEILADLADSGASRHDISLFRVGRFAPQRGFLSARASSRPPAGTAARLERRTVEAVAGKNGRLHRFPEAGEISAPW